MANAIRKRVALAVAVALGAGVMTAAPASAAAATATKTPFSVSNAESTSGARTTAVKATQIAGANNFVSIGFTGGDDNYKYDGTFAAGSLGGFLTITGGTFTTIGKANVTIDAAGTTAEMTNSTSTTNVNVLTPSAGTITVKFISRAWSAGVATDTTEQTITITVNEKATVGVLSTSTAFISATVGSAATEDSEASALTFARAASGKLARMSVKQYDVYENLVGDANAKGVTFTLSGVGSLGNSASTAGAGTYVAVTGAETAEAYVYSDGRAGTASVVIAVNGVTVATKTVTFYGPVASYSATVNKANVASSGSATADVVSVTAKDSAGNVIPSATVYASVGTSTVATVESSDTTSASGVAKFDVTGVATKSGEVTITFRNASTAASATVTTTAVVTVSSVRAATLTITSDKATYTPGEKITFTLTAKDANGLGLPDGTYAADTLISNVTGNPATTFSFTSTPFAGSASVAIKAGVATATAFAPLAVGPVTLTWTLPGTAGTATTNLSSALAGSKVTVNASVVAVEDPQITAAKAAAEAAKAEAAKATAEAAKATAAITTVQTSITAIQTAISTLVASFTSTLLVLQTNLNKVMKKLGIK